MKMKAKTATYSIGRSPARTSLESKLELSYVIIRLSWPRCIAFNLLMLFLPPSALESLFPSSLYIKCDYSIVLDTTSSLFKIMLMSLSLVSFESIFVSMLIS